MNQMIEQMPNFGAFLSFVFIATFTPGPNNIFSMSNASKYGAKKNLSFTLGVSVGFVVLLIIASVFSTLLYQFLPKIKTLMTLIGAAYILYLAWKTLKSNSRSQDQEESNEQVTSFFIHGVLMQFLNPKAIIYSITIMTTFISPYYGSSIPVTLVVAISLAFVTLLATNSWALFGSIFYRFLSKYETQINILMALLLVYTSISLFL